MRYMMKVCKRQGRQGDVRMMAAQEPWRVPGSEHHIVRQGKNNQ